MAQMIKYKRKLSFEEKKKRVKDRGDFMHIIYRKYEYSQFELVIGLDLHLLFGIFWIEKNV